jgi:hypothetical protein
LKAGCMKGRPLKESFPRPVVEYGLTGARKTSKETDRSTQHNASSTKARFDTMRYRKVRGNALPDRGL